MIAMRVTFSPVCARARKKKSDIICARKCAQMRARESEEEMKKKCVFLDTDTKVSLSLSLSLSFSLSLSLPLSLSFPNFPSFSFFLRRRK